MVLAKNETQIGANLKLEFFNSKKGNFKKEILIDFFSNDNVSNHEMTFNSSELCGDAFKCCVSADYLNKQNKTEKFKSCADVIIYDNRTNWEMENQANEGDIGRSSKLNRYRISNAFFSHLISFAMVAFLIFAIVNTCRRLYKIRDQFKWSDDMCDSLNDSSNASIFFIKTPEDADRPPSYQEVTKKPQEQRY